MLRVGDAEELLIELLAGQQAAGTAVQALLVASPDDLPRLSEQFSRQAGGRFETAFLPAATDLDPRLPLAVAAQAELWKPDLLHAHFESADLFATAAAQLLDLPSVSSRHGEPLGHGLLDQAKRRFDLFSRHRIADCRAVQERLLAAGQPANSISLVLPGRSARPTTPGRRWLLRQRWGVGPDEFLAGAVSELLPGKGIETLLEAFARLLETRAAGSRRVRLVIVGDGPERASLAERVASLSLATSVHFVAPDGPPSEFFDAFDLAIQPPEHGELGLRALDAMAAAKAVLATQVDTMPELVADGVTGRLVPPGNSVLLAVALAELTAAPEVLAEMGRMGRLRAEGCFNLTRAIESLGEIYETVLERRKQPAPAARPAS